MRILVNAMAMTGLLTGIARYLRNMYSEMACLEQVDVSYLTGKEVVEDTPPLADSMKWEKATAAVWKLPDFAVFCLRSVHWLRYEQILRGICRGEKIDIYHETAFVPAKLPDVPTVFSIYDLSIRRYRETHPQERVWFFEYFFKRRLPFAGHILTISEFIRQEIIDELKLPPEMVSSVPLAPDPIFGPRSREQVHEVLEHYGLPDSYLLFVGSLEPRKNIDCVINALQDARTDIPLVLAGWHGWGSKKWLETAKKAGLSGRIYIIGHIPDAHLAAIYNGATVLVYPSLYEGFGLPIVEAMACGCPVICSNVASMPEVAGEGALLIDPQNSDELASAIETVVTDSETRDNLVSQGHARTKLLSWQRTARETLTVFQKVSAEQ